MEGGHMSNCPNCGHSIPTQANYCNNCGQKQDKKALTVKGFIQNTLSTLLHYDSSVWNTFKYIFVPGKITEDYLAGKRKQYLNPVRLFVFLALLFFILSNPQDLTTTEGDLGPEGLRKNAYTSVNENQIIEQLGLNGLDTFPSDSIKDIYYSYINIGIIDTLRSSDSAKWSLDSLSVSLDTWPFESNKSIKIDIRDVYFMPPDSILQKYQVDNFLDRYMTRQIVRISSGLDSYGNYLLSKITWVFFLLIPFQAFFMKLFYWRRTYIEHVIFLLHLHSLGFLILIIYSIFQYILPTYFYFSNNSIIYLMLVMIGLGIYYYLATKRVYADKSWVNLLKMIPLFFTYWIGVIISMIIVVLSSLLLF
jgi:hypothetical protein